MKYNNKISKILVVLSLFFFLFGNELNAQCRNNFSEATNRKFSEKAYYSKIFNEAERTELSTQQRLITEAKNSLKKVKKLNADADKLYEQAEKTSKRLAKKRLESEARKTKNLAIETQEKAYNLFYSARAKKYTIYNNNIEDARYDSDVRDTREARKYESMARALAKNAKRYKDYAKSKTKTDLIKDYILADSIQIESNKNMENAFSAYNNDSPQESESMSNDIDEYNKFLAEKNKEYKTEITILLKGTDNVSWMKKVDYEYEKYQKSFELIKKEQQKIKDYEKKIANLEIQEKKEREIKNARSAIKRSNDLIKKQKRYAVKYEKSIISLLTMKINDDKLKNQEKFESYNEGFAHYNRNKSNSIVESAEREILSDLKVAKDYIYKAEFSNQCANARLKIYLYLLRANFHQAQAMDKLVDIRRKNPTLFRTGIVQLKESCFTDDQNTSTSTKPKKNSSSKNSGTKNSSTKNSTASSKNNTTKRNSNSWKYSNKKGIKYKVQILAQKKRASTSDFKTLAPISSERLSESTLTAYLVGSTTSMFTAEKTLKKAKQKGFKDAYVVAYFKGKRIALWEAEDIINGVKKESTKSNTTNTNTSNVAKINSKSLTKVTGIIYTVQVAYSKNTPTAQELKYLQPVYEYKLSNGYSKYTVGLFRDFSSADKESRKIKSKGIKDAFVTAYENGKPIQLNKAIQKTRN